MARMGNTGNAYNISVMIPLGKRPLGRPRRRQVVRMAAECSGSGSCPVVGFGIRGVEPSGFTTRETFLLL
jgi:hypothetical protein